MLSCEVLGIFPSFGGGCDQEVLESHDTEFIGKEFEQLSTHSEPENENPDAVVESSLTTCFQKMDD